MNFNEVPCIPVDPTFVLHQSCKVYGSKLLVDCHWQLVASGQKSALFTNNMLHPTTLCWKGA